MGAIYQGEVDALSLVEVYHQSIRRGHGISEFILNRDIGRADGRAREHVDLKIPLHTADLHPIPIFIDFNGIDEKPGDERVEGQCARVRVDGRRQRTDDKVLCGIPRLPDHRNVRAIGGRTD